MLDSLVPSSATTTPVVYRESLYDKRNTRVEWSDMFKDLPPIEVHQLFTRVKAKRRKSHKVSAHTVFDKESHAEARLPAYLPK